MDTIPTPMTAAGDDSWEVAGLRFRSRLIVGTGRYKDLEETGRAIAASGAEIVTVAVRRVNLGDPKAPMLQDFVDPKRYTYLPNTAGCFTAQDAVRTLRDDGFIAFNAGPLVAGAVQNIGRIGSHVQTPEKIGFNRYKNYAAQLRMVTRSKRRPYQASFLRAVPWV